MVPSSTMRAIAAIAMLAGCHGGATSQRTLLELRAACTDDQRWDGHACVATGEGPAKLAAGKQALAALKMDEAKSALDAAEKSGPLDHGANVTLWEQRGIAAAFVDDEATASTAFDMLLALDPSHFLSYRLSPKATFVFEKVRNDTKGRSPPAVDVNWSHGQKVGDPVPLDIGVLSDPKQFLRRATLFVRTRGDATWRAADLALDKAGTERHLVLPPVVATKPISLEVYLRAYDDRGNEVFTWADPARPREIPLRYDPPPPWWKKWWVLTIAGGVLAVGTGITVYQLTLAPPDKIGGSIGVAH
jgi:hypothetical protein